MAEKTPATIWACMEGPMVGLFVSGGYTAGWPKYIRADSHDKLVEALEALLKIIEDARADEAFDASTCDAGGVIFGDIASEAIEASRAALASLDQESGQ